MKILFAGIFHETHCFTTDRTTLTDFRIERGDSVFERRGDGSQIDGFLEVADRENWTVMPTASYTAMPSGIVSGRCLRDLLAGRRAGRGLPPHGPVSMPIYLSLHGAMVTESIDDVEGELLRRIRDYSPVWRGFRSSACSIYMRISQMPWRRTPMPRLLS